jgi:uncharacterized protein
MVYQTPPGLIPMPDLSSRDLPFWHAAAAIVLLGLSATTAGEATDGEKSGGWRLAGESSPYLRMHAENPVQWFPWGEQAFETARRENKPMFISIGYFTCHWCHVMARESFSNPEIAALLNERFVAIKVDREQRPDVDAAYMNYVVATRGQGGWPMSVWATPDGHPFVGGTYFPPDASEGQAGMKQLLIRIGELWRTEEDRVRKTADSAVAMLRKQATAVTPTPRLTAGTLVEARKQLTGSYDELQGGFEPAPKFPQPARLLFLLQDEEPASVAMALHTLDRMAAGGIYDQLEGGFHRYSTDSDWRVPHFEKMLYDQALIARAYLFAYRRTGAEKYAAMTRGILDFTLRQLRDPKGGFYAALSADSPVEAGQAGHMEEGAYYTWTWRQVTEALGEGGLRDWAAARFGLSESGNARGDPRGEMAGKNVLYLEAPAEALARQFKEDLGTANRRTAEAEERLLGARRRRPPVPLDDKVVTAWNGYMITTLAQAGRLLEEPRYSAAAAATAGFVMDTLYDDQTGILYRDWREGKRGVPGFSDDYAAMAEGLLMLYQVTGETPRLAQARRLLDTQLSLFWDEANGGFFQTTPDTELWVREKEASDGATLSANGMAVHVLLDLGGMTHDRTYRDKAVKTATWAGAQLWDVPAAMPYILIRWPELMQESEPVTGVPDGTGK